MESFGAVIGLERRELPICGGEPGAGQRVALSEDGQEFVLTYSEKGIVEVLAKNADGNVVMEQLFVEATSNLWTKFDTSPAADLFDPSLTSANTAQLREMAVALETKRAAVQEEFLGRLNPDWGRRQAMRNALRLQGIMKFFDA
jgi:hypothetical protein